MVLVCHMIQQDKVTEWSSNFKGGRRLRKVTTLPPKFGGLRHCDIGDIMLLVCHVILQYHETKGPFDFISSSPSR